MPINEYCMTNNDFMQPKVLKDAEAIATRLAWLILLEPGTFQSHPDMGVGLISKFRYGFEEDAATLKERIVDQINKYLPEYRGVSINVSFDKKDGYRISAEINGVLFGISYDKETNTPTTKYMQLSNL